MKKVHLALITFGMCLCLLFYNIGLWHNPIRNTVGNTVKEPSSCDMNESRLCNAGICLTVDNTRANVGDYNFALFYAQQGVNKPIGLVKYNLSETTEFYNGIISLSQNRMKSDLEKLEKRLK